MLRSMYSSISGLKTHQTALDVTANNIANVNTSGYKASRTSFQDSLAQTLRPSGAPGGGVGGSNAVQIGLGTKLGGIDLLVSQGGSQATGNALDVAIQGDGFLAVGTTAPPAVPGAGATQYTRAGSLHTDAAGYLVTEDGYYVLGRNAAGAGAPNTLLQIPTGATAVAIGGDGGVSYVPAGGGARATAGYLSLATFPSAQGLERNAGNRFLASQNSGVPNFGTAGPGFGVINSGSLEMSNVDLANEFTQMIAAQRGFQANSRVITTGDEMLQDLVNIKR